MTLSLDMVAFPDGIGLRRASSETGRKNSLSGMGESEDAWNVVGVLL